jgi:hypothetical protein
MTLALLYLRSRLTGWALLWLLVSAVGGWYLLSRVDESTLFVAMIAVPLLPAVVIGASARSPFGDVEETASFPLPAMRSAHFLGLLLLGGGLLVLAAALSDVANVNWELARNLAGYSGLALLCGRLLGPSVSWLAPLAYATLNLYLDPASRWAWPKRVPVDTWSIAVALTLITLGLVAATRSGARNRQDER